MLKRENVKNVAIENGKVFIQMADGKKKEVKTARNKEWLKNRLKEENFDNLTFLVEDYNNYNRECNRVFKFAKSRYLVDFGTEFKMMGREYGTVQWFDCEPHTRMREDSIVVKGTIYYIYKHKTNIKFLEKLHNAFDNIIISEHKRNMYSIFIGNKKMRNYK